MAAHAAFREPELRSIEALFGGPDILRHPLDTQLDAHEMLLHGLPNEALRHLMDNLRLLRMSPSLEQAVGMSLRTFQRRKDAPGQTLTPEQSGRTWKFAEILARATHVFGSQEEAEQWLERPAMGLDQRRPLDLLATPTGTKLVEDFLVRIKYGVYT